jgi:predicted RNA-binding protein YlxR (DUF448 family)
MATVKKIPTRLCIGCQEQHPKKELVRIVRSPEGEFSVDLTGKKAGRGAYICNKKECFEKAVKEHRFDRSFKCTVEKNIFDELGEQLFK